MLLFSRIEYSSKSRREKEDDIVYTAPNFVPPENVLGESLLKPESHSTCSESSTTDIFAELRLEKGSFVRFSHEATGIELTSSVVAEMLEEYDSIDIFVTLTCSRFTDTSITCIPSFHCCLIQQWFSTATRKNHYYSGAY